MDGHKSNLATLRAPFCRVNIIFLSFGHIVGFYPRVIFSLVSLFPQISAPRPFSVYHYRVSQSKPGQLLGEPIRVQTNTGQANQNASSPRQATLPALVVKWRGFVLTPHSGIHTTCGEEKYEYTQIHEVLIA